MTTTQHALNSEYALISEVRLITGKYGITTRERHERCRGFPRFGLYSWKFIVSDKNILGGLPIINCFERMSLEVMTGPPDWMTSKMIFISSDYPSRLARYVCSHASKHMHGWMYICSSEYVRIYQEIVSVLFGYCQRTSKCIHSNEH